MQKRELSVDDVVRILMERDVDEYPVATSTYVAAEADVSRPTALNRLKEGKEDGRIKGTQVGQASVWWAAADPITARHAEDIDVVELPANKDTGEVLADGAIGGEIQELQTLLRSNRELMEETRSQERRIRELRKPLFLFLVFFAGALAEAFYGLPDPARVGFGLLMFIAVVWAAVVLLKDPTPDTGDGE